MPDVHSAGSVVTNPFLKHLFGVCACRRSDLSASDGLSGPNRPAVGVEL